MDYIRTLLTLFRRQVPRPPSLDESPLALLPYEIIQHIASFLPPSSAASFALTCLPVHLITGTRYLNALHASRAETFEFLELLVADLPNDPVTGLPTHLLCLHCVRLTKFNSGRVCGVTATPACKQASALSKKHIQASFCPSLFRTAMAMHRRGRFPYEPLYRLTPATTTYRSPNGIASQWTWHYSIINGSLRLRTQATHILRPGCHECTFSPKPCPHTSSYQSRMDATVRLVQQEMRGKLRRTSKDFIKCLYCRTAVIIGARKFRLRGIGLFVVWWKDLGDGRVGDERWADQLRETAMPGQWKEISYDEKNLLEGFEKNHFCYFDFDGLKS